MSSVKCHESCMTNVIFSNTLILSPHRDDEALAAGGLIMSDKSAQIHVRYFNTVHPNVKQEIYDTEAENVLRYGKFESSVSALTGVNRLDCFPVADIIADIEQIINKIRPNTIIIPAPSYNQDHRVIYDAAITASRIHDKNWLVKNVLLMEQPETHTPAYVPFTPQLFVPIDIDQKLALYSLYESQVKLHRFLEHVRALARIRGMQCGVDYAEAYQVVRMMA